MPKKKKRTTKKTTRKKRKSPSVTKLERAFKKSIKNRRKFYKPQRSTKWREFKPEPEIRGRVKVLVSDLDVVKLGGVGRAFIISKINSRLKRTKFLSGSRKTIRITGIAKDNRGRIIRDRKINIEVGLDKGRRISTLGELASRRLKEQINSFSWKVSSAERRQRKKKGESIRSLKITVELIERKLTNAGKKARKKKSQSKGKKGEKKKK